MSLLSVLLGVIAVLMGLFAGLIVGMMSVVQSMLSGLTATEYARVMQGIIREGRRSRVILVLLLAPIALAVPVLILMSTRVTPAVFALAAVGVAVYVGGAFLGSRLQAEPLYDQIMGWDVETPPANWQEARQRWLRVNLVRVAGALAGFLLVGTAVNFSLL